MPVFPAHLLNPSSVKLGLTSKVVLSPASLSGVAQALRTDGGGLWQLTFSGISLHTDDKVRIWNAWESYLAGGAQRVTVPVLQNRFAPRGLQGGRLARFGGLAYTGDRYFPDSVSYGATLIVARAAAAPLRATILSITIDRGSTVMGGETFSIVHASKGNRTYRVVRKLPNGVFQIDPPLREGIGPDTPLNFDWPLLDAIVLPGSDLSPDIFNGTAGVSISFQEAF
jgi:hypothetical protein